MSEEICLSTRFLSLASNKLYSVSKQELKNELIKGDENYPRTITSTITFIQYHTLRGKEYLYDRYKGSRLEANFSQQGDGSDEDPPEPPKRVSKTCRQFKEGTCAYKKKSTHGKNAPQMYGGLTKENQPTMLVNSYCALLVNLRRHLSSMTMISLTVDYLAQVTLKILTIT